MDVDSLQFLLVTANVGSVFEDPSVLLKKWIEEFLVNVSSLKPACIALHLQEVGGKTYEKSMEYVQEFIKILRESEELKDYDRIRIYLDEDYNSAEHFTALGNLYFTHKSVDQLLIWNFVSQNWETVNDIEIHTGSIESIPTKEKAKFPQHFFPECKWSRKGFLKTRWSINGTVLDLVNIHLFHDASNLAACEEFPSVYCKSRRRALIYTLERFHKDVLNGPAPYFVFGDFNFRCDTEGVVKELTDNLTIHRIQNIKNDHTKIQYKNDDGENVLTVGKKEFVHADHQNKFREKWLTKFDRELEPLKDILFEYPIKFPPSYPYEEDPEMPSNYMLTRCPSWCDRILLSADAEKLIEKDCSNEADYGIVGENVCMGDHKPVYLSIRIKTNQGISKVCSCEHDIINTQCSDLMIINNSKQYPDMYHCLNCSEKMKNILLECKKINELSRNRVSITNDINIKTPSIIARKSLSCDDSGLENGNAICTSPLINVIDTENDINVCMCNLYKKDIFSSNLVNSNDINSFGQICQICCNTIRQHPSEHRKSLMSRNLKLAENIFVNHVDSHFLNTNCPRSFQDPYTPESIESHSPQLEYNYRDQSNNKNEPKPNLDSICNESIIVNNNPGYKAEYTAPVVIINSSPNPNNGVSPRQLKSRLERLKRKSFNKKRSPSNKGLCGNCKCTIL